MSKPLPYGLLRLSDMINCSIVLLETVCSQLMLESTSVGLLLQEDNCYNRLVESPEKERISKWVEFAQRAAADFELEAVRDRAHLFLKKLARPMRYATLHSELTVLKETLHYALRDELIYRYPRDKRELLLNWKKDWKTDIYQFPSS